MHVIRNCSVAREVWERLVPGSMHFKFFSPDGRDWVTWLLKKSDGGGLPERWPARMASVCWLQWKWRCQEVFNGQ